MIFVSRSYVAELKRRINREWAALGHVVIERAVGESRQHTPLAFVLEEDILSTCNNKKDVMWDVKLSER